MLMFTFQTVDPRHTGGLFGSAVPSLRHEEKLHLRPLKSSWQWELVKAGGGPYVGVSTRHRMESVPWRSLISGSQISTRGIVGRIATYSLVVRKDYEAGLAESCLSQRCPDTVVFASGGDFEWKVSLMSNVFKGSCLASFLVL
jgi:hypothetical protein